MVGHGGHGRFLLDQSVENEHRYGARFRDESRDVISNVRRVNIERRTFSLLFLPLRPSRTHSSRIKKKKKYFFEQTHQTHEEKLTTFVYSVSVFLIRPLIGAFENRDKTGGRAYAVSGPAATATAVVRAAMRVRPSGREI